jgi:hypothetical protein
MLLGAGIRPRPTSNSYGGKLVKLLGIISATVLSLSIAAPVYAQEQHEQQEEQKDKPAQEEKKTQPEKAAKPENKNTQQEEKNAQQDRNKNQEQKNAQQEKNNQQEQKSSQQRSPQQAQPERAQAGHGRIPDDRYRANFGREHTFHVSQGDYQNHRFQYGGYWFGFSDPWPSNWLYTQDVFVVDINGIYYLCNPMYPGVNIALNITL